MRNYLLLLLGLSTVIGCSLDVPESEFFGEPLCFDASRVRTTNFCETGGTCSFEFFTNSSLQISETSDSDTTLRAEILPGSDVVFRFLQVIPPDNVNRLDSLVRGVYFSVSESENIFTLRDEQLSAIQAFAFLECGANCTLNGTFLINVGCLEGEKIEGVYRVRMDIETDRTNAPPTREIIQGTFTKP